MALRFHWRLPQGGELDGASRGLQASLLATGLPDLENQINFCNHAEESGMDSLLVDFGWAKPDPVLLAAAIGMATSSIKFIVAYRSGLMVPTTFVQQLNTLSSLISGRFSLNIVAGSSPAEQKYYGDFLDHDARYERTEEFLAVCRALWEPGGEISFDGKHYRVEEAKINTPFLSADRSFPEIYIAGNSSSAKRLAITQGTCWMRFPDAPEKLADEIKPVLDQGKEVGLRMSVICRPTREEAVESAYSLVNAEEVKLRDRRREGSFVQVSDSHSMRHLYELAENEWLTDSLWTGAVRSHGAPSIALVGSPDEVASALMEYGEMGVTQFILSGWPKLSEMIFFGQEVVPLIRKKEAQVKEPAFIEVS